jgi:hypothetical protein
MLSKCKRYLVSTVTCCVISFGISSPQDVAANSETYKSLYSQLTQEAKNDAIAQGQVCYICTNKNAASHFIYTIDYNGHLARKLECFKKNDLSNPQPIRLKEFDGLHQLRVDEKYRGARYFSHIGTGLEIALGEGQNKATRAILGALDKNEKLADDNAVRVDKDTISETVDELLTDENVVEAVDEFLDQAEKAPGMFKKATQSMVKWLHNNFHYMKEYEGTPFIDEYKKYSTIVCKLNTIEELRGLLSLLTLKIDTIPEKKPLLILSIEEDRTLEKLTEEDNTLLKKLFTPTSPSDKEVRTYLDKSAKLMNQLIRLGVKWPHIKTSASQKFWFTVEEKCEDFDFERILPKIFIGSVIILALVYGDTFKDICKSHAKGSGWLKHKLGKGFDENGKKTAA